MPKSYSRMDRNFELLLLFLYFLSQLEVSPLVLMFPNITPPQINPFTCPPTRVLSPHQLTTAGSLQSIGFHLVISDNDRLSSLSGISNLLSIGQDLYIRRNPRLMSLSGLDGLSAVGGSMYIQENQELTSLGDLPNNLTGRIAGRK